MDPFAPFREKGISEDKIVEYQSVFRLFDGALSRSCSRASAAAGSSVTFSSFAGRAS
jgi:hypothetical protein